MMDRLGAFWRSGGWIMGMFALLAGLLAAWATQYYVGNRISEIEATTRVDTVERLVAAIDLVPGDILSEHTVAVSLVPVQWALADGLSPEAFFEHEGALVNHALRPGEQLSAMFLHAPKSPSLASKLIPGRRAITIAVDDISSQAGWLLPDNRLDIYLTLDHASRRLTTLLLRSVRVLAVGQPSDQTEDEQVITFSTVTLDVSQAEAVRLINAREAGTLSAILQNDPQHADKSSLVDLSYDVQLALGLVAPRPKTVRRSVPVLYGRSTSSEGVADENDDMSYRSGDGSEAFQ